MAESRPMICSWERGPNGWTLWVRKHPRLRGAGKSFDDAAQGLYRAICLKTGDGEPRLSFVPGLPAPDGEMAYFQHDWVILAGTGLLLTHGNCCKHFAGPICSQCKFPTGARHPRPLEQADSDGDDLLMCGLDWSGVIVSERFLKLLRPRERAALDIRPVVRLKGTRKQFFEVRPRVFVSAVVPRDRKMLGHVCDTCGVGDPAAYVDGHGWITYVASRQFQRALPPIFGVGQLSRYTLAFPRRRATNLVQNPHARGASLQLLGALPRGRIDTNPAISLRNSARTERREVARYIRLYNAARR